MKDKKTERADRNAGGVVPVRVAGVMGVLLGIAFVPPLFARVFAMGILIPSEIVGLWMFSITMIALSGYALCRSPRIGRRVTAAALGTMAVIALELLVRLAVNVFDAGARDGLAWKADRTRPEMMQIKGHPFLHYVGNDRRSNNFGFSGERDFSYTKETNTVRVVCLGGSTTESYWPFMMEVFLNSQAASMERRFEVLNLGKQGYTSLHVLINFVMNAIEFSPDYVVVHSGWNDAVIRDRANPVKRDYSEIFKVFEPPVIPDKWPLRLSVVYRLLRGRSGSVPAWADTRSTLEKSPYVAPPVPYEHPEELLPFEHNIEKIIDLAEQRSIQIVLTTLPHSSDREIAMFEDARHIDQCNEVVRRLHEERAGACLLVDLAAVLTGQNAYYTDVAHMTPEGDRMKAVSIGNAIIEDLNSRKTQ